MSDISCKDLINNVDPINPFDQENPCYEQYKRIFEDLQGGIIKNYGRKYTLYIFIQFIKDKDEVNRWIRDEIAGKITSTWQQLCNTKTFKEERERREQQHLDDSTCGGEPCINFFLSHEGYATLGFKFKDPDARFREGMKKAWTARYHLARPPQDAYWYNPPEYWDIGGDQQKDQRSIPDHSDAGGDQKDQSSNVHALISLAHDSVQNLEDAAKILISQCETIGKVIACEAGYVLRDPNHKSIGPFGFADGISQPLFLQGDYDKYLARHTKQGDTLVWNPKASLSLVLVEDPFRDEFGDEHSYGSYCVWQKLETDYERFKRKVECLADQFKFGGDRERASALMIGRFKDGTPLDLSDRPNQSSGAINNFNYRGDPGGGRCPLQAHIRKVNPRNELTASLDKNRIFRAGITYFDDPTVPQHSDLSPLQQCLNRLDYLNNVVRKQMLEDQIESISGLLFVSFQRSIVTQFSLLQEEWADTRNFPPTEKGGRCLDPIIGHPATSSLQNPPIQQEWPKTWGDDRDSFYYSFYGCVKSRGGEFLFAPSISFLKNLTRR